MAFKISLPDCLTQAYQCIFPTIQWDHVQFFLGVPFPQNLGPESAFTAQVGGDVHINIRPEKYRPCSPDTFLLIAHELVHALQIQSLPGGGSLPGAGGFQSFTCYLAGGFSSDHGNCLEEEAYEFANGFPDDPDSGVLAQAIGNATLLPPCSCDLTGQVAGGFPVPNGDFCAQLIQHPEFVKSTTTCTVGDCLRDLITKYNVVGVVWAAFSIVIGIIGGFLSIFGLPGEIAGAIGAVIGAIVGIVAGLLSGLLGAVVGAVLGALVGALLGGIIGAIIGAFVSFFEWLFGDDGGQLNLLFSTDDGASFPSEKATFERSREQMALAMAPNGSGLRLFVGWTGLDSGVNVFLSPDSVKRTFEVSNNCGPALAFDVSRGLLFVVWQGTDNRLNLRSTADISNLDVWSDKITLDMPHCPGDATPGVAFAGALFLGWIDQSNGVNLWASPDDGTSWPFRLALGEVSRGNGTCAVAADDASGLFLAWNGSDAINPHAIRFQSFTRSGGIAVAVGPARNVVVDGVEVVADADAGPALAFGNRRVFLAWVADTGHSINVASSLDGGATFSTHDAFEISRGNAGVALAFAIGIVAAGWTGAD